MSLEIGVKDVFPLKCWEVVVRMVTEYSNNHPESKDEIQMVVHHLEALLQFKWRLEKAVVDPLRVGA